MSKFVPETESIFSTSEHQNTIMVESSEAQDDFLKQFQDPASTQDDALIPITIDDPTISYEKAEDELVPTILFQKNSLDLTQRYPVLSVAFYPENNLSKDSVRFNISHNQTKSQAYRGGILFNGMSFQQVYKAGINISAFVGTLSWSALTPYAIKNYGLSRIMSFGKLLRISVGWAKNGAIIQNEYLDFIAMTKDFSVSGYGTPTLKVSINFVSVTPLAFSICDTALIRTYFKVLSNLEIIPDENVVKIGQRSAEIVSEMVSSFVSIETTGEIASRDIGIIESEAIKCNHLNEKLILQLIKTMEFSPTTEIAFGEGGVGEIAVPTEETIAGSAAGTIGSTIINLGTSIAEQAMLSKLDDNWIPLKSLLRLLKELMVSEIFSGKIDVKFIYDDIVQIHKDEFGEETRHLFNLENLLVDLENFIKNFMEMGEKANFNTILGVVSKIINSGNILPSFKGNNLVIVEQFSPKPAQEIIFKVSVDSMAKPTNKYKFDLASPNSVIRGANLSLNIGNQILNSYLTLGNFAINSVDMGDLDTTIVNAGFGVLTKSQIDKLIEIYGAITPNWLKSISEQGVGSKYVIAGDEASEDAMYVLDLMTLPGLKVAKLDDEKICENINNGRELTPGQSKELLDRIRPIIEDGMFRSIFLKAPLAGGITIWGTRDIRPFDLIGLKNTGVDILDENEYFTRSVQHTVNTTMWQTVLQITMYVKNMAWQSVEAIVTDENILENVEAMGEAIEGASRSFGNVLGKTISSGFRTGVDERIPVPPNIT